MRVMEQLPEQARKQKHMAAFHSVHRAARFEAAVPPGDSFFDWWMQAKLLAHHEVARLNTANQ